LLYNYSTSVLPPSYLAKPRASAPNSTLIFLLCFRRGTASTTGGDVSNVALEAYLRVLHPQLRWRALSIHHVLNYLNHQHIQRGVGDGKGLLRFGDIVSSE